MRGRRRKLQNAKDASRALARGSNLSRSDSGDSSPYREIRHAGCAKDITCFFENVKDNKRHNIINSVKKSQVRQMDRESKRLRA